MHKSALAALTSRTARASRILSCGLTRPRGTWPRNWSGGAACGREILGVGSAGSPGTAEGLVAAAFLPTTNWADPRACSAEPARPRGARSNLGNGNVVHGKAVPRALQSSSPHNEVGTPIVEGSCGAGAPCPGPHPTEDCIGPSSRNRGPSTGRGGHSGPKMAQSTSRN